MQTVKLLIDFGLVVLIWMTQLIVYPAFTYYSSNDMVQWHGRYTMAISLIVAPLMIAQVLLHGWELVSNPGILSYINAFLIALIWINTFLFAVPLHNQISSGTQVIEAAHRLVSINWYRTVLWSIVFVITLYQTYK